MHGGTALNINRGVGVTPEAIDPWTPANKCLTATNKIDRNKIQGFFGEQLAALKKQGIK